MPPIDPASPEASAVADDKAPRKYLRAAAVVRRQITDGVLRPGQPAPSGAELSRLTGYAVLTCRRALRLLITEGVLVPGPSRNARPRVAGAAQHPGEQDLAAAERALSAGLSARRRAAGLTQPELAARAGVSVTTVGHAETGRLWQSRRFWERADSVLGAGGGLLRLHDAYRAASAAALSRDAGAPTGVPDPVPDLGAGAVAGGGGGAEPAGSQPRPFLHPLFPAAGDPQAAGIPLPRGQAGIAQAEWWPGEREGEPGPTVTPACVTIVWSDGTVTTVRPPQTSRTGPASPAVPPPGDQGPDRPVPGTSGR